MSKDFWIKIILPGMDAVLGSLQGRITTDSFPNTSRGIALDECLNKAIEEGSSFKLYDPIQLRPHTTEQGQVGTMTIPLIQALAPTVQTEYIWVNGQSVQWWAPLEVDERWERIVSESIHGITLANGNEEVPDPKIIQPFSD